MKLELDHDPALARRDWDRQTRHHIPHQHHPDALIYRVKSDHDRKTNGRPSTTLGSDKHEIAKTQRLEERRADREAADFRKRLLHPGDPEEPRQERAKPKYRWPSRPFPKNQKNR